MKTLAFLSLSSVVSLPAIVLMQHDGMPLIHTLTVLLLLTWSERAWQARKQ